MKNLITEDDYGVFTNQKEVARVDSLFVATTFEKGHRHVLRDIARTTEPRFGLSENFIHNNFMLNTYKDAIEGKLPRYLLTRDGFTMLVMGYTDPKAMYFKELYIQRFNELEQCVQSLLYGRQEFPMLTDMICRLHESLKPYHFSNECNILNRIVLGMSVKQFRLVDGIEKGQTLQSYLTARQLHALDRLQHMDYDLLYSCPDFQQRKQRLITPITRRNWRDEACFTSVKELINGAMEVTI